MKPSSTLGISACVVIVCGMTTASAQIWGRPDLPRSGVCFYEDKNFGGRYFCSRAGTTGEVPAGTNDQISSIRILGDAVVTVFRDIGFRGSSKRIEIDVSDLRKEGWNDRISSFRVDVRRSEGSWGSGNSGGGWYGQGDNGKWGSTWGRPPVPSLGACFYQDANFGGQYFCSRVGTTIAQAPPGTEDMISSIRVFGDANVTVFRDPGFQGPSRRFDSDASNLQKLDWNDRISSFRVETRGNWGGGSWGGSQNRTRREVSFQEAQAIIQRAYRTVLGRDPDPASGGWVSEVMKGNLTELELMEELRNTPEYRERQKRR